MDFEEAFGPDVTTTQFFEEVLPQLHSDFRRDLEAASDVDVIVSVYLRDIDDRWTVRHDAATRELEIEHDEMIDFPHLTIVGEARFWDRVKEGILPLAEAIDVRRDELRGQYRVTPAFRDDFEQIDGVIDIEITGGDEVVTLSLVFNNYDADDFFPRISVSIPFDLMQEVARGDVPPETAIRGLSFSGDKRFALEFGGLLATHFED